MGLGGQPWAWPAVWAAFSFPATIRTVISEPHRAAPHRQPGGPGAEVRQRRAAWAEGSRGGGAPFRFPGPVNFSKTGCFFLSVSLGC